MYLNLEVPHHVPHDAGGHQEANGLYAEKRGRENHLITTVIHKHPVLTAMVLKHKREIRET